MERDVSACDGHAPRRAADLLNSLREVDGLLADAEQIIADSQGESLANGHLTRLTAHQAAGVIEGVAEVRRVLLGLARRYGDGADMGRHVNASWALRQTLDEAADRLERMRFPRGVGGAPGAGREPYDETTIHEMADVLRRARDVLK